jgi:hypothetical protein
VFEDYTSKQLIELRSLCAELIERTAALEQRADALLILENIDRELALRGEKEAA